MSESSEVEKGAMEQAPKAVHSRVGRLLSAAREHAVREMAEAAACAILLGRPLDELYFENVTALDGVEEAINQIISSTPACAGESRREPTDARTAVEDLSAELEDSVKRAAERLRSIWGTGLWLCPAERMADLICNVVAGLSNQVPDPPAPHENGIPVGPGPSPCRRWGLAELSRADGRGAYTLAVRQGPDWESPAGGGENRQAFEIAYDHIVRGNELEPELAIAEYQKALAISPGCVMGHFFLAEAFEDVGNLDAALAEFSQVTRLAPDDPDAHWRFGEALLATGDVDTAAMEYATALRIAPADEWLLEQYALLDADVDAEVRDSIRDHLSRMQK